MDNQEWLFLCMLGLITCLIQYSLREINRVPPPPDPIPQPVPVIEAHQLRAINTELRTPYDEDTIVGIIHDIYTVFIELCYLEEDDVIWPPPGSQGHSIDEALCHVLGIEPRVISLMRRLPYPRQNLEQWPFLVPSAPIFYSYLDPESIHLGRDTMSNPNFESDLDENYVQSQDLVLTNGDNFFITLILDTKESETLPHWP